MNYRQAFVSRALDLINSHKGNVPTEVRSIIKELGVSKDPSTLSSEEFNLLQETADRIDTQIRINQVQRSMRRSTRSAEHRYNIIERPYRKK